MKVWAFLYFTSIATVAHAEFHVQEPFEQPLIESILKNVAPMVNTDGPIAVVVGSCGQQNAWWDPNSETITFCQEVVEAIAVKTQRAIQSGGVDADVAKQAATGEMAFALLHELAHALIDRHHIAFTGREESAADQFAAWLLMRSNNVNVYVGATNFFASPERMLKVFGSRQLSDEHELNEQRRVQLVCWGYGRSQKVFSAMAEHLKIPPHRLRRCASEYQALMLNTPRAFQPALVFEK